MTPPKRIGGQVKAWVDRTIQGLEAESRERDNLILGLRKQRFMRLKPKAPEAYQRYLGEGVRVPISFRLVETVIGAVAGEERAEFHVATSDLELAQRARTWLQLCFDGQERWSQSAMYYRFWDGLIGDGFVAFKTLRRAWTDFPERNEEESDEQYNDRVEDYLRAAPPVPFKTRVVDGATFKPPRSEWGRGYALETGLRPTADAFRQMGLRASLNGSIQVVRSADEPTPTIMPGLRLGPRVKVDELWTDQDVFVRIGGNVFQYENDLGRLPYLWASGSALAFSDPTLQALSVLYPLQYLEPWVNQFLSTLVAQGTATSTPTPVTTHEAVGTMASAAETVITDFEAGRHHDLPPGSDLKFVSPPLDGGAINLFNSMVQLAERFTLSPVPQFAGTRTPGVVLSAVAERIMAVLKPRVDQAKMTLGELGKMYLELTKDTVRAPVRVSGLVFEERSGRSRVAETVLTPRDVPKISDVMVDIRFQTLQDKIAWDTHNVLMVQSGMWSKERGMRESRVRDPEAERRMVLLDRIREQPAIQAYLEQRAISGQPPLEALQELFAAAQQEVGDIGSAGSALAGAFSQNGDEATARPQGGRNPGEARQPGGERPLTAQAFV